MHTEQAYAFRNTLLQIHEPHLRQAGKLPTADQLALKDGAVIAFSSDAGQVVRTAAEDFADYLMTSMELLSVTAEAGLLNAEAVVRLHPISDANAELLGEANQYKGFLIQTDDVIDIYAHDERGMAQALYYLEDVMSFARAPFVDKGDITRWAMFSPQMVHSSYGLDEYPDNYLARIAHEGRDAILVFTKDVNQTPGGYLDFNNLIERAARYGIDVYAYSYYISDMSPEAEGAEEYYENSYGRLFRECPGLKGVTLVGESVEFPSRDPHVSPGRVNRTAVDGIPTGKCTSGWYPCEDYPIWLNLVSRVIRKYNKDADIVFWTYNWGYHPEEARVKLIENLPKDISLEATFEMFEVRTYGEFRAHCADYTLAFEGPGKYFASEAKAAKENGIRLYSMTNTGGLTWDLGTIPYEPMPYQWMKRYDAMRKAKDDWGLSGIMESHHYGFYPSFISKLSKWAFMEPRQPLETVAKQVIKGTFGTENFEKTNQALMLWSEAIRYFTPTDADQYGAFRVGPSYPFCLDGAMNLPSSPEAMFGNSILSPTYSFAVDVRDSVISLRIGEEIKSLKKMHSLLEEGLALLKEAPEQNEKLAELINLGTYIMRSVQTGIHAKEWYVLCCQQKVTTEKEALTRILDEMEALLLAEIENARKTIPLVEADSRLGWEPSMLYMTDKWHLEWKIRQVEYTIEQGIGRYRKCLAN